MANERVAMEKSVKVTVKCCDVCGCEVDFDTGFCAVCDCYPAVTTFLVDADERRPDSHVSPENRRIFPEEFGPYLVPNSRLIHSRMPSHLL